MTEDEIFNLLFQAQGWGPFDHAANQYGSGADYMMQGSKTAPYGPARNRMAFATDINRMGGFYLDDLLGIDPAPERPDAPSMTGNDAAEVWRSNPVLRDAIELIESGAADPTMALNSVRSRVESGEYGDEAKQLLPQRFDQWSGQPSGDTDWSEVLGILTGVAETNAKFQRETAEYDRQANEYNEYHRPRSALDDIGYGPSSGKTMEDFIRETMGLNPQFANRVIHNKTTGVPDMRGPGRLTSATKDGAVGGAMGAAQSAANFGGSGSKVMGTRKGVERMPGPSGFDAIKDIHYQREFGRQADNNVKRLAAAERPSLNERDNRDRMRAIYSILSGQPAPR